MEKSVYCSPAQLKYGCQDAQYDSEGHTSCQMVSPDGDGYMECPNLSTMSNVYSSNNSVYCTPAQLQKGCQNAQYDEEGDTSCQMPDPSGGGYMDCPNFS
jgi:hypothetical protein